jgi:Cu+-exporting ATPase
MRTTLTALCLCLCLASASAVACGGVTPAPGAPLAASAAGVKAPGQAQVGDKTTCPVSGEEFVVAADSPRAELDGKTYYFCCAGCVKKFQADPKKYAARPAS